MKIILFWLISSVNALLGAFLLLQLIYSKNQIERTSYGISILLILAAVITMWAKMKDGLVTNLILALIPIAIVGANYLYFEVLK